MPRIIRIKEVCAIVGLSRSSILRMESCGQFPAKFNLNVRAVGWHEDDVQRWLEERRCGAGRASAVKQ